MEEEKENPKADILYLNNKIENFELSFNLSEFRLKLKKLFHLESKENNDIIIIYIMLQKKEKETIEEYVEVKTDEDYKLMLDRIESNKIKDNSILIETDRLCGEISRMIPKSFEDEIQCVVSAELEAASERIKKYLSGNKNCIPNSQNTEKKECSKCNQIITGNIFRSVIDIEENIYCEKCSYLKREPVFIIH